MTLQQWIQENRYANTLPRRIGATLLKLAVETAVPAVVALPVAFAARWVFRERQLVALGFAGSWLVVWIVLTAAGLQMMWCFSSDTDSEE